MKDWWVYVLRCGDGSLYTGMAKDVKARLKIHQQGKGAAYTRSHLPLKLIHHTGPFTRSEALKREAAFKKLSRSEKISLIIK